VAIRVESCSTRMPSELDLLGPRGPRRARAQALAEKRDVAKEGTQRGGRVPTLPPFAHPPACPATTNGGS